MLHFILAILMSVGILHAGTTGPNTNQYHGTYNANSKQSHRSLGIKENAGHVQWFALAGTQSGLPSSEALGYGQSLISLFGLTVSEILGDRSAIGPDLLLFGDYDNTVDVTINNATSGNNFSFVQVSPKIVASGGLGIAVFSGTTNPAFTAIGIQPLFSPTATISDGVTIYGDLIIFGSLTLTGSSKLTVMGNLYVFGQSDNYLQLNNGTLTVHGDILLNGMNLPSGTTGKSLTIATGSTLNVTDGALHILNHYSAASTAVTINGTVSATEDIVLTRNVGSTSVNIGASATLDSEGSIFFASNTGTNGIAVQLSGACLATLGNAYFINNSGTNSNQASVLIANTLSAVDISFNKNSSGAIGGNGVWVSSSAQLQATGNISFNANQGGSGSASGFGCGVRLDAGSILNASSSITFSANIGGSGTALSVNGHSGVYLYSTTVTANNLKFTGNIGGVQFSGLSAGNGVEVGTASIPSNTYSFNNIAGATSAGSGLLYLGSPLTIQNGVSTTKYTGPIPQLNRTQYIQFGDNGTAVQVTINNSTSSSNIVLSPTSPVTAGAGTAVAITAVTGSGTTAPIVSSGTTPTVSNTASVSDGVTIAGDVIMYGSLILSGSSKLTITGNLIVYGKINNYVQLNSGSLTVGGSIIFDGGNDYNGTNGYFLILASMVQGSQNISIQNNYASASNTAVSILSSITTSNVLSVVANKATNNISIYCEDVTLRTNGNNSQINVVANSSIGAVMYNNNSMSTVSGDYGQVNYIANSSSGDYAIIFSTATVSGNYGQVNYIANSSGSGDGVHIENVSATQLNCFCNQGSLRGVRLVSASVDQLNGIANSTSGAANDGFVVAGGTVNVSDQCNLISNTGTRLGAFFSSSAGSVLSSSKLYCIANAATAVTGSSRGVEFDGLTNGIDQMKYISNTGIQYGVFFGGSAISGVHNLDCIANIGITTSSGVYYNKQMQSSSNGSSFNFIANKGVGNDGVTFGEPLTMQGGFVNFIANNGGGDSGVFFYTNIVNAGEVNLISNTGVNQGVWVSTGNSITANSINSYGGLTGYGLVYYGTNYPTTAGLVYTGPIPPA